VITTGDAPRVAPVHVGLIAARQMPGYSVYLSVVMELSKPLRPCQECDI
jgi:hypothetical protein